MIKPIKSVLFFFFIGIVLAFPSIINAQSSNAAKSQRWVCLNVDWCLDQAAFNASPRRYVANPKCSTASQQMSVAGHRVRLTAKTDAKPLPNKDTYIVECLSTVNGQVCTTGDVTDDTLIYGKDNAAVLNASDKYIFQGQFASDGVTTASNPVKSLGNGDIDPIERQSYSQDNERKFLAMNFIDPNSGADWLGKGGEQQGTFTFEAQSNLKNCVSISWDPYGRVFDSQTLEPIPGASVTLLKQRNSQTYTPLVPSEILGGAIINPYLSKQDGRFSFVVPDGIYQLSVNVSNYTFPNNTSQLNANYSKAYSDLYPNATGQDIVQQGTAQHRDIPLDPKGSGITYPVKLIQYFYNLDKATNQILVEGEVSHPLTTIRFYSLKANTETPTRYKLLTTVRADKYGNFNTSINQNQFEPNEVFGDIELVKNDLTVSSQLQTDFLQKIVRFITGNVLKVEAAQPVTTTVRLNPIFNQIQGYAYNAGRQTMPNTSVGVYLAYASKPYAETTTDQQGFYTMTAGQLPDSPYTIKYTGPQGGSTSISTARFLAQNAAYFAQNKININSGLTGQASGQNQKNSPQHAPTGMNFNTSNQPTIRPIAGSAQKSATNSSIVLIVLILLVLLGGVGLLLGLFLVKKRQQHY